VGRAALLAADLTMSAPPRADKDQYYPKRGLQAEG
jgi:hypothetical protein